MNDKTQWTNTVAPVFPTNKSELDILNSSDAASEVKVSERTILAAFRSGELEGTNLKGRKGWVTTRGALARWVEGGNKTDETEEESAFNDSPTS